MPEPMSRLLPWYALMAAVLVLDLWSKGLARELLVSWQPVQLLPVLELRLHYNSGAAFGLLSSAGAWGRWFLVLTSIVVIVFLLRWLHRAAVAGLVFSAGSALVIGGALGNLYERLFADRGAVTDFISVHWQQWYFPTFNFADSAITIGAGLLLLSLWREGSE